MPARNPPTLPPPPETGRPPLPVPTGADVEGFVSFYRERFGVELSPEEAHGVLGGLMRFLYLTGGNRSSDASSSTGGGGDNGED